MMDNVDAYCYVVQYPIAAVYHRHTEALHLQQWKSTGWKYVPLAAPAPIPFIGDSNSIHQYHMEWSGVG